MIIWRGLGILVPLIVAVVFISTLSLVDLAANNTDYSKWHYWPKALGAILAAAAVWFLGRYLNGRPGKVVIEKETGQEITLRSVHDVFFLKFEYWAFVLIAFAVIGYFA
ncbi:MAG TPA: hypothetical protein VHO24_01795 [Opitutaceae bacterium]|nr:hypothetical protein [Opitutaceae bacterium]